MLYVCECGAAFELQEQGHRCPRCPRNNESHSGRNGGLGHISSFPQSGHFRHATPQPSPEHTETAAGLVADIEPSLHYSEFAWPAQDYAYNKHSDRYYRVLPTALPILYDTPKQGGIFLVDLSLLEGFSGKDTP